MITLQERILKVSGARESRYNTAQYILAHEELFEALLMLCFSSNTQIAKRASWVFEFVCMERNYLITPHYTYIIKNLPKLTNDSIKRPICRALYENLKLEDKNNSLKKVLSTKDEQRLIETCFDWLIGNEKVALKCHSMRMLYILGQHYNWVHKELHPILEQNIHLHTAGYKAAAKEILKKLAK